MWADHERVQQRICGLSMIAAPALLILSELLRAISEPPSQINFVSQVLALGSLGFFIPAVIGLLRVLRTWSPAATLWAAALVCLGILGSTSTVTLRLVLWGLERTLDADLFLSARRALPLQVLVLVFVPSLLFSVGLATLAIGLYRTKVVPRWVSVLFISGSILFPLASVPDVAPLILLACLAFLVALSRIGTAIMASSFPK